MFSDLAIVNLKFYTGNHEKMIDEMQILYNRTDERGSKKLSYTK
jgi:hypothetical protein